MKEKEKVMNIEYQKAIRHSKLREKRQQYKQKTA